MLKVQIEFEAAEKLLCIVFYHYHVLQLSKFIVREMSTDANDFLVNVLSLQPASGKKKKTQATVFIEFLLATDATSLQLSETMLRFVDTGRIGRKRVTAVQGWCLRSVLTRRCFTG